MNDLSPEQQRREDAWGVLKRMSDEEKYGPSLMAPDGWCAPSSVIYQGFRVLNANGQVVIEVPDGTVTVTGMP